MEHIFIGVSVKRPKTKLLDSFLICLGFFLFLFFKLDRILLCQIPKNIHNGGSLIIVAERVFYCRKQESSMAKHLNSCLFTSFKLVCFPNDVWHSSTQVKPRALLNMQLLYNYHDRLDLACFYSSQKNV